MIVSHEHRFVFFAVPRTGSHAIRAALQPHLGTDAWQQQSLTAQLRFPVPQLARIGHGHITLQEMQAHLPERFWRTYFKFAIVRNPFDRFVSACAFLYSRSPVYRGNETFFRHDALRRFGHQMLIRPQVELLVDASGRLGMDFIGRYETLDESFGQICRTVGLPELKLARVNSAEHPPWATCYDGRLSKAVADFYCKDFNLLGYPNRLPDIQ